MKRSLRNLVAVVSALALMIVAAPAAQAQVVPCTMQYGRDVLQSSSPELVTYTPPATVTVNGNAVVGMADYVVGVTADYVVCVVWG